MKDESIKVPDYSSALRDSIGADAIDTTTDLAEVGFDYALSASVEGYEDCLAEVPIVKVGVLAYKFYRGFASCHFQKKLTAFINRMNSHISTPEEIVRFKSKFTENDKEQSRQIEYLLTIIDAYVGYEKPEMLASLYIAFLDGLINWPELTRYSETIGRFLPGDYEWLESHSNYQSSEAEIDSAALRLVGLGLMLETNNANPFSARDNGNVAITPSSLKRVSSRVHEYSRTSFGDKLVDILASK